MTIEDGQNWRRNIGPLGLPRPTLWPGELWENTRLPLTLTSYNCFTTERSQTWVNFTGAE